MSVWGLNAQPAAMTIRPWTRRNCSPPLRRLSWQQTPLDQHFQFWRLAGWIHCCKKLFGNYSKNWGQWIKFSKQCLATHKIIRQNSFQNPLFVVKTVTLKNKILSKDLNQCSFEFTYSIFKWVCTSKKASLLESIFKTIVSFDSFNVNLLIILGRFPIFFVGLSVCALFCDSLFMLRMNARTPSILVRLLPLKTTAL